MILIANRENMNYTIRKLKEHLLSNMSKPEYYVTLFISIFMASCASSMENKNAVYITHVLTDSCWIGKIDTTKCQPIDAKILSSVDPIYPRDADIKRIESSVKVLVKIGKSGFPTEIKVLESGGTDFDNAVKLAVIKSRYSPLIINCEPVECGFVKRYTFVNR